MKQFLRVCMMVLMLAVTTGSLSAQIITEENTDNKPSLNKKRDRSPEDRLFKIDNFFVGGIPGFGVSNNFVSVTTAAEAGYFIHPNISIGGRFTYQYYLDRFYEDKLHIYGGGPFIRGYIWKGLFAQMEYETTSVGNIRVIDTFGNTIGKLRLNVNALLLGGGFHDNFDDGFGYYISVLFNVINTETYIYPNPVIRFGLTYNFMPAQ